MKLIKHYIIAMLLLSCTKAIAQQLPQFTQYMYNTISINPAYAGSRETLTIVGLHRTQWAGLDGAPITQTLSIHTPLRNERIGLGLSFINDEIGDENFSYLYSDVSYTIPISNKIKLAFGLKAGFTSFSLDQELRLAAPNDPSVYGIEDRWTPNIGLGTFLHSNRWYLGLSAPRVLNTNKNKEEGFEVLERINYYFTGGYVFNLNGTTKFKPAFLVKATNGAPLSYDLTANFLFNEKLWLGASYRINQTTGAFGGIADFQISKQLRIGYAYEHELSDIRSFSNGGTHEILIMFEFINSKRIKSPRYF